VVIVTIKRARSGQINHSSFDLRPFLFWLAAYIHA
jgi:hypothetical protein